MASTKIGLKARAKTGAKPKKKVQPKNRAEENDQNTCDQTPAGKVAWWLILGLLALVPIAMANGPLGWMGFSFVDGFDGVKVFVLRVGVMAVLAAWIWDVVINGAEIRYHKIYILVGILLGWIVFTTVMSIDPATAFLGKYRRYDGAWSYFLYALLFFLTMQYATSRFRIRQIAQAISVSSVVVAGYGLLQAIPNPWGTTADGSIANWDPLTWGALPFEPLRSFSTFGNPNLLAGFLAFGVFINLGLLLSESNIQWRRWYWFVLLLNSTVAITAFSRSLWVALFVTGIIFAILLWRQRPSLTNEDRYFAGGLAAIVTAIIAFSLRQPDAVMNFWTRVQTIFEFDRGSGLTRFQIWDAAIAAIGQSPIYGYGLDTFRLIFRHFAPAEYAQAAGFRSVADNAHNFPLQLATGIGIVGTILVFAVFFWIAYLAIRACISTGNGALTSFDSGEDKGSSDEKSTKAARVLYITIVCACITYCVHLFFGLSLPGTTFILWILMAVLLMPYAKIVKIKPITWMIPFAIFCSVTLLLPMIFATRLLVADSAYVLPSRVVAVGVSNVNPDDLYDAKIEAERMVRLNPFYERYYLDYFVIMSTYALMHLQSDTPEAALLIEESKDRAQHLIDLSPWEYDSYLAVANFYINLGRISEGEIGRGYYQHAVEFMREKLERTPTGLALRMRLADALIALGDIEGAYAELVFIVQHDTNHATAAETLQRLIEEHPSLGYVTDGE